MQFFISFLTGIVLFYSFQYFPFSTVFISVLSSIYLLVKKRLLLILIIISGIAFAFIRYEPVKDIPDISGKGFAVKGIFEYPPTKTESGMFTQDLNIKSAVDIKTGVEVNELTGQEVVLFSDREFNPGTEFELAIKFLKSRKRLNPGEQSRDNLYANLTDIYNLGNRRISLSSKIQEYRYKLNRYIEENFKKDSGAFIASITTGQRANMDEELRDSFNVTGLAHILSISGTHFGLFSMLLFGMFSFLIKALPYRILQRITIFLTPSQAAAILCFPFMLAYLGLSGASIPAVRSFIMIGLFLSGLLIGRKGFWLNSLLFAAFIIVVWEPESIFSLSFQLSFLAVLFIGFSIENKEDEKRDNEKKEDKRVFRYVKNAVLLTLSASIGTAPLVAYYFHYFSIISPLSNLFIAPLIGFVLIPLSVFSSFLFLITGHYMFTPIVSAISDVSLLLVKIFSHIPFADIKIPAFPPIVVLLFYAGFIFYFLSPENTFSTSPQPPPLARPASQSEAGEGGGWGRGNLHSSLYQLIWRNFSLRKRHTLIIPFVPIVIYLSLTIFEKNELKVTYLDVGQGDSSVIELPDGKAMVVDTGRTGRETASFLKYRGKKTVDVLILSHIHIDHTGGLDYIAKRFEVKELWDGGRLIYPEDFITHRKVKHRTLNRGDMVEGKGYSIYIFHPYPEFYTMYGSESVEVDNDSLVLKIKGNNKSFLFTGDIEEEAEENISHLGNWLKSDILKVPHHGSKKSAYEPFLKMVSPGVAVISAGRGNSFGHPHKETLDALHGAKIFRTDIDGAIKIKESINGLEVKIYKDFQFKKARSFNDEGKNIKRLFEAW
ncbi:MAG: ComEC/Rec2 family competence protein [Nitrospirota bacterium]|nr:ComEC/Rec2 family competence protein [Nitrospirota bacterium]